MGLRRVLAGLSLLLAAAPASASVPMVFFDWDSAEISPNAASILDSIAEEARRGGFTIVRLEGMADRSGHATHNRRLSIRRAGAVRAFLAARGVSGDRIEIVGWGETRSLIDTQEGVREPANRNVLVVYGR
jgi:OmpA-OmpF porin, OOP family